MKQEFFPTHHIFIDYQSSDKTIDLINTYKERDTNIEIILINQKSCGIYQAWNQGILKLFEMIDLDHYIIILNSDDWLVDDYINTIAKYKGYDLIAGSSFVYYQNKRLLRPCRNLKMLPFFMPIIDPSLCIKASVFDYIGLYREKFKVASDHDFIYRAYEMGCSFKIIKKVLVNIEMGGFAIQNKDIALLEQFILAKERNLLPFPEIAFLYRLLKFPRMRFLDFL